MAPARLATVIAILLAGGGAPLAAQGGIIRGHVVRADQHVGLADADLELRSSGARTRTDARGFFELRGIPPGQVELAVRRLGFAPMVVALQVAAHTATEVDHTARACRHHPEQHRYHCHGG